MIRVGLLVDRSEGGRSLDLLFDWMAGRNDVLLDHLIVCHPAQGARADRTWGSRLSGAARAIRQAPFRLLCALERWIMRRSGKYCDRLATIDVSQRFSQRLDLTVRRASGDRYRATPADEARVRALGLDVILRCGGVALEGGILQAARCAMLALPVENEAGGADAALGFWEVLRHSGRSTFRIVRLDAAAGQAVVCSGAARTRHFFQFNRICLVARCFGQLRWLLPGLARGLPLSAFAASEPQPLPGAWSVLLYALRVAVPRLTYFVQRRLGFDYRWSVAYYDGPWHGLKSSSLRTIPCPAGRFLADPFVIEREGRVVCFVEDYVYEKQRGRITAYELTADGAVELGVALDEPFHLSFPYIFTYQGQLYLCPECTEARQLRIYRCLEFPLRWQLAEVAMDGVALADPLLFEHSGSWWLLANRDYGGDGDYCSELELYSADSPLGGLWTPHPKNPLRIDSDGARNAGILIEGHRILRPAQRQGFAIYGRGLSIYEVKTLTTSEYQETRLRDFGPEDIPGFAGLHHMTSCGRFSVIDRISLMRSSRPA